MHNVWIIIKREYLERVRSRAFWIMTILVPALMWGVIVLPSQLLMRQKGKTILFSTHRMDTVERLCDAIALVDHGRVVLDGDLKQIKAGYGRNNVQIEYDGEDGFLQDSKLVKSANNYGNYVEVQLAPGADAQELLKLIAARARVSKFELVEPSLEEIFIDVVGKSEAAHA